VAGKFDCFMLHVNAGTNEKLAILSDSEYRAHISGILAIAATAPVRGRLLVGEMEAEPIQIARKAGVTAAVVASAMEKMKRIGVLYRDEELDCWAIHDWEKLNPEPKKDNTAAERQRRYRERRRAEIAEQAQVGNAPRHVTSRRDGRDGHAITGQVSRPPEVEGEGEVENSNARAVPTAEELSLDRCVGTDAAGEREREDPDVAPSGGTA